VTAPPIRYGVIGSGWRARFYLRLARQLPGRFQCVGAVTRSAEHGGRLEQEWGIPAYRSARDLAEGEAPDLVVTSVTKAANPEVIESLVGLGIPVLSETPPAPDLDGLRKLWASVGPSGLVHVAEQHPYLPVFVALNALLQRGVLGHVTSAHISWTHDYHAMALLRFLLGAAYEPARVVALESPGPLIEGPGRQGWAADPQARPAVHTVGLIGLAGRTGIYDFTDGQWFHPLRRRHLIVRGSHGEVVGRDVTWIPDDGRPVSAPIVREQAGLDGNLEVAGLVTLNWAGEVLYRNPYPGTRMSDEEIAIATCLERTARWHQGGSEPPYSLAGACQDQLLALAVHAAAETGGPVTTDAEPWATAARRTWG
jgi:predicted dehydrogenase